MRAIESKANLGFVPSNLEIEHPNGRHVVLQNNDNRLRPGWLAALVQAAQAQPDVRGVTKRLVFMGRPDVIQNAETILLSSGTGADRGRERG